MFVIFYESLNNEAIYVTQAMRSTPALL